MVGARNDVVDVEPDTVNTVRNVNITSELRGGMIFIVVLLIILFLVVWVLFVGLRIDPGVILIIVGDGSQQRALLGS
jgi:4-hydroxybenzoate polyprenyltransferase